MKTDATDKKSLGIYLHLPFCLKKCNYCDFCSFAGTGRDVISRYCRQLAERVKRFSADCTNYSVDTVYFGGGTPTLAPAEDLCSVLAAVRENYRMSPDAEISVECNPATGDGEYFARLHGAGFNRLSIGLQSTDDGELKLLGRAHSFEDFLETFGQARAAGFANISADVMFGIPNQTKDSFARTLSVLTDLSPEHISAYGLKIEEGTPFAKIKEKLVLPDEETESLMYSFCVNYLGGKGYNKYEISNFSKPGYKSCHNLRYWTGLDYLGFGVSAHSFFRGERFRNSDDIAAFLRGENIEAEREKISGNDILNEYLILRLRLSEGIDKADFRGKNRQGNSVGFPRLRTT